MSKKIKKFLVRNLYQVANPIRKLYWLVFRPKTRGVKCILEHGGQVLFVRLGYAHESWTIPGGRVNKNELFETATYRELFEEVGIKVNGLIKIGEYDSNKEFKRDHVEVFYGKVSSPNFAVDDFEIVEAKWSKPLNLPTPYARRVPDLMKIFLNFKNGK